MTRNNTNKIIHEQIMGECWHEWRAHASFYCHYKCSKCDKVIQTGSMMTPEGGPNYTDDANNTLKLLEKFIDAKIHLDCGRYSVVLTNNTKELFGTTTHTNLLIAICYAALRTLKITEKIDTF